MEHVDQVTGPGDLAEPQSRANALVVVLPLTADTFHLLGEKGIGLMKVDVTFSFRF